MTRVVYESAFKSGSVPAPGYVGSLMECPCQPEYSSTVKLEYTACSPSCSTHPAWKIQCTPAASVELVQIVAEWEPGRACPQCLAAHMASANPAQPNGIVLISRRPLARRLAINGAFAPTPNVGPKLRRRLAVARPDRGVALNCGSALSIHPRALKIAW